MGGIQLVILYLPNVQPAQVPNVVGLPDYITKNYEYKASEIFRF